LIRDGKKKGLTEEGKWAKARRSIFCVYKKKGEGSPSLKIGCYHLCLEKGARTKKRDERTAGKI